MTVFCSGTHTYTCNHISIIINTINTRVHTKSTVPSSLCECMMQVMCMRMECMYMYIHVHVCASTYKYAI